MVLLFFCSSPPESRHRIVPPWRQWPDVEGLQPSCHPSPLLATILRSVMRGLLGWLKTAHRVDRGPRQPQAGASQTNSDKTGGCWTGCRFTHTACVFTEPSLNSAIFNPADPAQPAPASSRIPTTSTSSWGTTRRVRCFFFLALDLFVV